MLIYPCIYLIPPLTGTRVCQPQKANTQKCFWNRLEPLGAAATAALAVAATVCEGSYKLIVNIEKHKLIHLDIYFIN